MEGGTLVQQTWEEEKTEIFKEFGLVVDIVENDNRCGWSCSKVPNV